MAKRFNPAPGWPPAPEGFVPPQGWRPDPSWPPAPPAWQFWVDDVAESESAPTAPEMKASALAIASGTPSEQGTDEQPPTAPPSAELVPTAGNAPAVPLVPHPSWRERRAEKRSAKEHAKALKDWQAEQDLLDRLATAARAAVAGGGGAASGVILKSGESLLWDGAARLVETHRESGHYQGGYSGVSFRIAKGVRYSVGGTRGHYVPGPEVQTPVDVGRAVITTQRALFTGSKTTREWSYAKLVSIDTSSEDHFVMIHVSNRQKVSGLSLGKAGTEFTTFLSLGVSIFQHGAEAVAGDCEQAAVSHRDDRP